MLPVYGFHASSTLRISSLCSEGRTASSPSMLLTYRIVQRMASISPSPFRLVLHAHLPAAPSIPFNDVEAAPPRASLVGGKAQAFHLAVYELDVGSEPKRIVIHLSSSSASSNDGDEPPRRKEVKRMSKATIISNKKRAVKPVHSPQPQERISLSKNPC